MKKFVLACVWAMSAVALFAQTRMPSIPRERPYWFILEEGKKAFREADYGKALSLFEEARDERRQRYTRMETAFISLLSIGEVRRLGDSLDSIEKYIEERNQFDAETALAELFYCVGREAVHGSAKTALQFFGRLKEYPEAEFWIGEVFHLEGENAIALKQYRKALQYLVEAESPLWRIEVLYKIAEINRGMRNYPQMEEALNEILAEDKLWVESGTFVRNAMAATLENKGIHEFLLMYRHKNNPMERAHRMLGEFYYKSGRYIPAETHLAFAALEQNTAIIDEAIRVRFDFTFTTLQQLSSEISRRNDLKKYMADTDYYRTLYYLAASLYANGKNSPAREIWTFVSAQPDAGEWRLRSANQVRNPFVEAAIKNP